MHVSTIGTVTQCDIGIFREAAPEERLVCWCFIGEVIPEGHGIEAGIEIKNWRPNTAEQLEGFVD